MSTPNVALAGFAYGEDLEGLPPRSLGYRLLAPLQAEPWCAEVESLARRLQGAPYPDHWPATDLFCSILLADGRRLIAMARYGLADHTPSQRRGGLELIGVVAAADLDVPSALTVWRWLQTRRAQADDLHGLGGQVCLADVLSTAAPAPPAADPVPVLPIRLWQEGALLFAATAPSDPDHRLGLLDQGAGRSWQWLPLVGPDFPLAAYAQRGPLVAWTPHLAGVAVKVERKQPEAPRPIRGSRLLVLGSAALLLTVILTVGAVLLGQIALLRAEVAALASQPAAPLSGPLATGRAAPPTDESRERLALALHEVLQDRIPPGEWDQLQPHLLAAYERTVRRRPDLALKESNVKGKEALGAVMILADRSPSRVEETVRLALSDRGYDPALVKIAAERVRQQMIEEMRKGPQE